eukprot:5150753-Prymnesium_polylepis.2
MAAHGSHGSSKANCKTHNVAQFELQQTGGGRRHTGGAVRVASGGRTSADDLVVDGRLPDVLLEHVRALLPAVLTEFELGEKVLPILALRHLKTHVTKGVGARGARLVRRLPRIVRERMQQPHPAKGAIRLRPTPKGPTPANAATLKRAPGPFWV